MNLDELLDVTEAVEVPFMDHTVSVHVYTCGPERLTKEQRELVTKAEEDRPAAPEGEMSEAQEKAQRQKVYSANIDSVRAVLPIIVSGIDLDGEPLVYKDKSFPENVPFFPDSLLVAVSDAALNKWNAANPTSGEESPAGEQQGETQEQNQLVTT